MVKNLFFILIAIINTAYSAGQKNLKVNNLQETMAPSDIAIFNTQLREFEHECSKAESSLIASLRDFDAASKAIDADFSQQQEAQEANGSGLFGAFEKKLFVDLSSEEMPLRLGSDLPWDQSGNPYQDYVLIKPGIYGSDVIKTFIFLGHVANEKFFNENLKKHNTQQILNTIKNSKNEIFNMLYDVSRDTEGAIILDEKTKIIENFFIEKCFNSPITTLLKNKKILITLLSYLTNIEILSTAQKLCLDEESTFTSLIKPLKKSIDTAISKQLNEEMQVLLNPYTPNRRHFRAEESNKAKQKERNLREQANNVYRDFYQLSDEEKLRYNYPLDWYRATHKDELIKFLDKPLLRFGVTDIGALLISMAAGQTATIAKIIPTIRKQALIFNAGQNPSYQDILINYNNFIDSYTFFITKRLITLAYFAKQQELSYKQLWLKYLLQNLDKLKQLLDPMNNSSNQNDEHLISFIEKHYQESLFSWWQFKSYNMAKTELIIETIILTPVWITLAPTLFRYIKNNLFPSNAEFID